MKKDETTIFGHKNLIYREYKSLKSLLDEFKFSLDEADVRIPNVSCSISPEELNQEKISSTTYLIWAKDDLDKNSEASYSNSISNSKKAVIRRQDEILSDILDIKLNGEKAIFKFLSEDLKINIPDLIKKIIIDPRNNLEHDFSIPKKDSAKDAYELACLFLSSTEKYLNDCLVECLEIGTFSQESISFLEVLKKGIKISFGTNTRKKGKRFLIDFFDITDSSLTGNYTIIDSENDSYINLICAIIAFRDKREKIKDTLYNC